MAKPLLAWCTLRFGVKEAIEPSTSLSTNLCILQNPLNLLKVLATETCEEQLMLGDLHFADVIFSKACDEFAL